MLKIGYMEYANVYPIFYYLLQNKYVEFYKSYPAKLNEAMRNGKIDLSPASCIEYARNPKLYSIISGLSISSIGPVKSVNIFSNYQPKELHNKKIYFTKESNTSTVLARIILEKFYNIKPVYVNDINNADAELLIGDSALYSYYNTNYKYIIDLGKEWYHYTNLPFVFALWIVRKEVINNQSFATIYDELKRIVSICSKDYNILIDKYIPLGYTSEQMIDYWNTINYNLTDNHIEGLKLFYNLAYEINEIDSIPELIFY